LYKNNVEKLVKKKDIDQSALILANRISQDLWFRKYYTYLSVSPILLGYINEQRIFWLNQYNIEYQNKYKLHQYYLKKKKEKKNKEKIINLEIGSMFVDLHNKICEIENDKLKNIL